MRPKLTAFIASLACALTSCEREPPPSPPPVNAETGRLSFATIREAALEAAPGEILEVELKVKGNHSLYEFKILSANGRVIEVELDAATGAVLELEQE